MLTTVSVGKFSEKKENFIRLIGKGFVSLNNKVAWVFEECITSTKPCFAKLSWQVVSCMDSLSMKVLKSKYYRGVHGVDALSPKHNTSYT